MAAERKSEAGGGAAAPGVSLLLLQQQRFRIDEFIESFRGMESSSATHPPASVSAKASKASAARPSVA